MKCKARNFPVHYVYIATMVTRNHIGSWLIGNNSSIYIPHKVFKVGYTSYDVTERLEKLCIKYPIFSIANIEEIYTCYCELIDSGLKFSDNSKPILLCKRETLIHER